MARANQIAHQTEEPPVARLVARCGSETAPLNVELTLEPHVYLLDAELIVDLGEHASTVPHSFKDGSSAAWRHLKPSAQDGTVSFTIWWRAIANASPDAAYKALITVRDSRCRLLEGGRGFANPAVAAGRIGPAHNPTDIGRVTITVEAAGVVDLAGTRALRLRPPSVPAGGPEN